MRRIACSRFEEIEGCFRPSRDRYIFDLWEANRRQLISAGVTPNHIETAGIAPYAIRACGVTAGTGLPPGERRRSWGCYNDGVAAVVSCVAAWRALLAASSGVPVHARMPDTAFPA